jgi:hypothetical protein
MSIELEDESSSWAQLVMYTAFGFVALGGIIVVFFDPAASSSICSLSRGLRLARDAEDGLLHRRAVRRDNLEVKVDLLELEVNHLATKVKAIERLQAHVTKLHNEVAALKRKS